MSVVSGPFCRRLALLRPEAVCVRQSDAERSAGNRLYCWVLVPIPPSQQTQPNEP